MWDLWTKIFVFRNSQVKQVVSLDSNTFDNLQVSWSTTSFAFRCLRTVNNTNIFFWLYIKKHTSLHQVTNKTVNIRRRIIYTWSDDNSVLSTKTAAFSSYWSSHIPHSSQNRAQSFTHPGSRSGQEAGIIVEVGSLSVSPSYCGNHLRR